MSHRHLHKGDAYVKLYPRETARWLNTCAICECRGYRPDMPDVITRGTIETGFATHLRANFEPLALNGQGLCDQCANASGL